jgi:long-chain fatty acid transport protein
MPAYKRNRSGSANWNADWDDQFVYKVGVAYDVLVKKFVEKVTLRAGYNYGKHPLKSVRPFEDISLPAILEHHITGGVGIDLTENLGCNIGFVWAPRNEFDAANVGEFINKAHMETSAYSIDAGLFYKF